MERHRQRVDRERKDSKRLSPVCRGVLRKGSLHQSKGLGKGPAPNAPKQVEAHVQVVVGGKYGVNMTFGYAPPPPLRAGGVQCRGRRGRFGALPNALFGLVEVPETDHMRRPCQKGQGPGSSRDNAVWTTQYLQ